MKLGPKSGTPGGKLGGALLVAVDEDEADELDPVPVPKSVEVREVDDVAELTVAADESPRAFDTFTDPLAITEPLARALDVVAVVDARLAELVDVAVCSKEAVL